MNLTEWLLEEKIAHHWKHAQNIIVGLELFDLYNEGKFDEIKARARLYRDWRNSQIYPKSDTKSCYEKAIAGVAVPITPLITEAFHSEFDT